MEKNSRDLKENLETVVSEKYHFLFKQEFLSTFELISIKAFDFEIDKNNQISEFGVEIHADYMNSCDGDANSIGNMLYKIDESLSSFLTNYPLNPNTMKFGNYDDFIISSGLFMNFNYRLDELHEFKVYYRIDYER